MNQRKTDFNKFFEMLMLNQEILACSYLEEFVSIHDYKGFKEVKKMREKEVRPSTINEFSTRNGKASVKVECMNPKLIFDYNNFFIDWYSSALLNLRICTGNIEEYAKKLSDSIQDFSRNIQSLSDLYSDCGFDEFNDLLQSISSLSTSYS